MTKNNSLINVLNKHNLLPNQTGIYIGRGSPLGNPICIEGMSNHPSCKKVVKTRGEAISEFEKYLREEIWSGNPEICNAVNGLIIDRLNDREINLICFCAPKPCHGEVVKKFVEEQKYCINWFSNMRGFDSPLVYQNISYHTVENFYQAMKTEKGDTTTRLKIAGANPFEAKKLGRRIKPIRKDWEEIKLEVMTFALKHKFGVNTSWGKKLVEFNQGRGELIEWNNWEDQYWGKCVFSGEGENNLGKILMEIREELS
jgi:ribA/ribD-fused uncharacterized protein